MADSTYTAPATYTITFPSLSQSEVKVSIDGVLQSSGFTISGYATSGSGTVAFTSAPTAGSTVRIFRDTTILNNQAPAPKADFQSGASIKAVELNNNMDQVLFKLAEKIDEGDISNDAVVTQAIRDLSVTTAKLAGSAVTTAKINNLDVTTAKIDNLAVTTAKINDGAVTNAKLEDNSVSLAKMQDNSVDTSELVDAAVTNAKLEDNSVSLAKMQDNSVDTAELVVNAVTTAKITNLNVTTDKINNLAVTNAKLDADAVSTVKVIDDAITEPKLAANSVTNRQIADGSIDGAKITDGTLDLQAVLAVDIRTLAEQNASPDDAGTDDEIATTAALNKRFDVLYQSGQPSGNDFPAGKVWYDHGADQTLSIWSGSSWVSIASGGTFTTQPKVLYVDAENGSDSNDGHRIIDPIKTIKYAVSQAEHGDVIIVAPGIYREIAPIEITKNNVSIIGESLRSCFVHPTPATELNSLFRVNSGTQIQNFSFGGLKASGTRGGHTRDNNSTYGLPTNQAFVVEFFPNAVIYKSPYIQNCTNFADSGIYNHTQAEYNADNSLGGFFDPNNVNQGGFGGDLTSGPTGGGLLVDGSAVSSSSPLRSMVVDSFTQIALDGPGILCTNNGYAQLVSFFGTFCHYHAKALNGGQLNLSNCTTDYGRYGLIADGKSPTANFTAAVSATAATGATTFTVGAQTAGAGWYGSATRPQDNMLVVIGSNTYPVQSAVANGSGWDVTIENPDPAALGTNLGLVSGLSVGDVASFHNRSYISTGGHTFEYVGAGTDYRAAPENGGVPIETNQVKNLNNGKVFQSSTDHNGKFKVGETFAVNQRTGSVEISLDAYRPEVVNDLSPELGGDLDVLARSIVSSSNRDINITPHGTGGVVMSTAAVSDLTSGRVVVAGTNGELQDNGNLTFNGSTLSVTGEVNSSNGLTATGAISLAGLTYPSADGATDQVLKTDGSGNLGFVGISALQGAGMQDLSDDSTPQLGGELDAVTNKITNLGTPTANTDAATKAYVDTSLGNIDAAFIETPQTMTTNKVVAANTNAGMMGPTVALNTGVTLTVGTNSVLTTIV